HALGAHALHRVVEPDEQALQVVLAGLLDLAALHPHVVDGQLLPRLQRREVEAQGRHVGGQLLGRLLERHEDAVLAVLEGAADQELHGEERLAAAGAAADQRGAAARQPAAGELIQPPDAGWRLGQRCEASGPSPGRALRKVSAWHWWWPV